MREHLFRGVNPNKNGKTTIILNGETIKGDWVEGFYLTQKGAFTDEKTHLIIKEIGSSWYAVLPETVGEYTGFTDKNGKKIFEGDIIADGGGEPLYVCVFDSGRFGFYSLKEYLDEDFSFYDDDFVTEICTIIGNIHETLDKK